MSTRHVSSSVRGADTDGRRVVDVRGDRAASDSQVGGATTAGRRPHPGLPAVLGMLLVALVLLPFAVLGGSYVYVSNEAKVSQLDRTDAIVVLGAAQFDGTPSPVFEARLNHAASLYRQGVAPAIITVGGKQAGDRFTEAEVGRNWLIKNGVPAGSVIAARDGSNTRESLVSVARVAQDNGWSSITLDSDPAHMARSRAIAQRLGFEVRTNPTSAGDGSQVTGEYLVKETAAYLAFELLDQWDVPRLINQ